MTRAAAWAVLGSVGRRTGGALSAVARLAVLAVLAVLTAATCTAAEGAGLAALQREIDDTRDVAAEVAKAVPRVQQENETLRASLSAAAGDLSAVDISAAKMREAGLVVDAVRSHLRTIDNRIERREAELQLLDRRIETAAAAVQETGEPSLDSLAAEAAQRKQGELRAIGTELVEGLRRLADAEAEHLAFAEERLALLQSRVELRGLRDPSEFEQNPHVVALRAIVSRLTRDGTRRANEAAAIEPTSPGDRVRQRLQELQADDAIARGTQRLIDLELLRIRSQIEFLDELAGNRSIPVRVLRDGRREFERLRSRLDARLEELAEERRALEDRRQLIRGQSGDTSELHELQLPLVTSLEELLDFQQADIGQLQAQMGAADQRLDSEVGGRELRALVQRRQLPADPRHRDLLGSELALLPTATLSHWRRLADEARTRLPASSGSSSGSLLALVAGAIALFGVALWWLYRTGLRRLVALDPGGLPSLPIEALRRTLPSLLPVLAWSVLALVSGLDARSAWLIAGALALWPLTDVLLHTYDLLLARTKRTSSPGRWGRAALIASAVVGALVFVAHTAPMLPSLADVVDRVGFLGVALAAMGTSTMRRVLLAALRNAPQMSPGWLRSLSVATLAIPGLLALAALAGLTGWVDLGWTIAAGLAAVLVATGMVIGVACTLRNLARPIKARLGARRDVAAIDAAIRLAVIVLAVGTAWFLVGAYTQSAAVAASFWVLAIAIVLPFVLQPVEALVEFFLRINPDQQGEGSVSVLAICVDRGVRALLIVGAVLGLASLLDFDLAALASGDTLQGQVVRGAFNIALVALLADFVWQLAKTVIDRRLALEGEAAGPAEVGGEGGGQGASRLRTLLPLLRKFLVITLAVMVVMLVMSSLGVDIGPLLAGAGVIGLAIGFGAQTLVRDIVSGVFFLMDDAFRLGEYVDVGAAKGTVEHISIRSMRLRHHRGALHTIPFGEITHLSNYSRDWVIMKLQFRVPYDTDMQKVKKIFKKIGAEMMTDETLGPNLLDPPKSQGVFQMDDSAMIVRAKFMAKPGEQFIIRRELYHRVQKEFDAAGIEFARRQVSVFVPPGADAQASAAAAVAAAEEEEAAAGGKGTPAGQ